LYLTSASFFGLEVILKSSHPPEVGSIKPEVKIASATSEICRDLSTAVLV
jgi:hypothetical protein